ncbi:hypothetical protein V6N11_061450 [Hibiscus sabdariffa]|uniref:RNase H type-1 domain-containing protein n=1 Tax=Hibiscus sabdariffa TaxID=183260 RepID=A0ABR2NVX3_9ROSI
MDVKLADNSLLAVKATFAIYFAAIRTQLSLNWKVEVYHIGHSANGVADSLARLLHGAPIGSLTFAEPPVKAAMALLKDNQSL